MNYQLVLQFVVNSTADFDRLVSLETKLIESLGEVGVVDGHDFGSGTFNIFVLTNEPTIAFTRSHQAILKEGVPVPVAMTITGHRTDSMFRRYAIVNEEQKREALAKTQAYLATAA